MRCLRVLGDDLRIGNGVAWLNRAAVAATTLCAGTRTDLPRHRHLLIFTVAVSRTIGATRAAVSLPTLPLSLSTLPLSLSLPLALALSLPLSLLTLLALPLPLLALLPLSLSLSLLALLPLLSLLALITTVIG